MLEYAIVPVRATEFAEVETSLKVCCAKQNQKIRKLQQISLWLAFSNNGYNRRDYARKCCTRAAILEHPEEPASCGLKRRRWNILRSRQSRIHYLINFI